MASGARRPPEWRSGVRSVRAPGGRAWAVRYGRREPHAGLVVSGHPSCATFGRLGWRRLRLEVPCGPRSRLVAGCWKYMQGGGWWVGGQPSSRLVPQPSEGQERAVCTALTQSLSDLPRGGGRLRRAVDRSRHGASVSPDREGGMLAFAQKAAWGAPRAPRPDAAGVWEAAGA